MELTTQLQVVPEDSEDSVISPTSLNDSQKDPPPSESVIGPGGTLTEVQSTVVSSYH